MKFVLGPVLLLLSCSSLWAQHPPVEQYKESFTIRAAPTKERITIDGELKEAAWQQAQPAGGFWHHWPSDKDQAARQTDVRITFDKNFLYIAALCYDSTAAGIFMSSNLAATRMYDSVARPMENGTDREAVKQQ